MVIVNDGRTLITGDPVDVALDTIGFLGTINRMKREDYEHYLVLEASLKAVFEEEPELINEIKEFAINMTEIFN